MSESRPERRRIPVRSAGAGAPERPAPDDAHGAVDANATGLDGLAFEVNTDASLVDPDWSVFAEEHERRFEMPIRFLKKRVDGRALDNDVTKVRVGDGGYWIESRRFPAAFFGDTARAEVEAVDVAEAQALVWEAVALYRSGEAQSLTCVYRDGDPPEVFFGYRGGGERWELGAIQSTLPLHLRVMVEADEDSPLVGGRRGVFVYQRGEPDGHHVVRAAGRRLPLMGQGDLRV